MPTSKFANTYNERRTWDRIALTGNTLERYLAVQNPMTITAMRRVALYDPAIGIRIAAVSRLGWRECEDVLSHIISSSSDDSILKGAARWQLRKLGGLRREPLSDSEKAFILLQRPMLRE